MTHWRVSVALSRLTGGAPHQPLCARVYLMPDGPLRSALVAALGRAFADPEHCRRIHDIWALGAALR